MSKVLVPGLLRCCLGRALDCRPDAALDQVNERFARSDILGVLELLEIALDVDVETIVDDTADED
jgi:hypothetical protein